MWNCMDYRQNNMSVTATRNNNVSLFVHFMDTFSERVHAADMKEHDTSLIRRNPVTL
jgi:hypothetical protein